MCRNLSKINFLQIKQHLKYFNRKTSLQCRLYSKVANKNVVINCRRPEFNFYTDTIYDDKLTAIPLVSRGWNHNKSKGDNFTIQAQPNSYDKPSVSFSSIGVAPPLIDALAKLNIKEATSFQADVIPTLRTGDHAYVAAETGCGKTIAYLLPMLQMLMNKKTDELNQPSALILVPNRELAHQIGEVAQSLADAVGLKVKVLVGGRTKKIMFDPEYDDIDILVATPGVLSKLSTVGHYKLNHVMFTVVDEADTLFDDSFEDRISILVKRVSQSQFVFTSATFPKKFPGVIAPIIENMNTMKSPQLHMPLLNVNQKFIRLTKSSRPGFLLDIAKNIKGDLLVFTNKNETCNWLAMFLRENGVKCANINGEMNYHIRIDQWNQFIKGDVNVLSATDVGSRGLDTTQIKHVLNYDFPLYASDYIHRIGRTGRLGSVKDSRITNFICGEREIKLVQQIELAIRTKTEIPNVDGNIKAIIDRQVARQMREMV